MKQWFCKFHRTTITSRMSSTRVSCCEPFAGIEPMFNHREAQGKLHYSDCLKDQLFARCTRLCMHFETDIFFSRALSNCVVVVCICPQTSCMDDSDAYQGFSVRNM